MMKKRLLIIAGIILLAGIGALVFYFYKTSQNNPASVVRQDDFIQNTFQAPAVSGNVVNSGIAGNIVLLGGGPYEYEASLDIFKVDDLSKPFISVRSDSSGAFQIPLRPGSYILKPIDPDGDIASVKTSYSFTIGSGQWLQVRVEYNSISE